MPAHTQRCNKTGENFCRHSETFLSCRLFNRVKWTVEKATLFFFFTLKGKRKTNSWDALLAFGNILFTARNTKAEFQQNWLLGKQKRKTTPLLVCLSKKGAVKEPKRQFCLYFLILNWRLQMTNLLLPLCSFLIATVYANHNLKLLWSQ